MLLFFSSDLLWLKDQTLSTHEGVQSTSEVSDEAKKYLLKFINHARLKSELSAVDAKVLTTIFGGTLPSPSFV